MKNILFFLLLFISSQLFAQSSYLNRYADDAYLLDRYELLNLRNTDSLFSTDKGISRKDAVRFLENYYKKNAENISVIDKSNIATLISKSGEWASNDIGAQDSKYPIYNTIYTKKPNLLDLNYNGDHIIINPIIYYQQGIAPKGLDKNQNLFINTKGIEVRASISKKIGLYTSITDNQERGPQHHQNYVLNNTAIPNATYYKPFKVDKPGFAQDYLIARGYVDAEVLKNKVNLSLGHYNFHIGDGYRSMFLSDRGSDYMFFKINTRLGKFNYQNIFAELTPQYLRGLDQQLPKKYAAMHHLSINVNKWLHVGVFESVIFARKDHFDFQYLNPVILYRGVEQALGSPDNAMLGLNYKINTGVKAIIYGQLLFDEFNFGQLKQGNSWANKWAFQTGVKATDIFGIKNLYLQGEFNIVRPFTYSNDDSVTEYSHYNQALAHPLGSDLMELIAIAKYQPAKNLFLTLKGIYVQQGRDSLNNKSYGNNIFKNNGSGYRFSDNNVGFFNGSQSDVLYLNANISYELKNNLYIDAGATYRSESASSSINANYKNSFMYLGFRLNTIRREYDY
jgi:hypothetical protein